MIVIVQLEDKLPVSRCSHTGSRSGGSSVNGGRGSGSGNNRANLTSGSDTVAAKRKVGKLGSTMSPDVYELNSTPEGEGDHATKNKEHDDQRAAVSTVLKNRSLMNGTRPVMEQNTTHPIDVPLGSSCSGEPENRIPEDDDDTRRVTEDNTTYPIDIPLADTFQCRIFAPIPKWYKRHGDLSKHTRRYHA